MKTIGYLLLLLLNSCMLLPTYVSSYNVGGNHLMYVMEKEIVFPLPADPEVIMYHQYRLENDKRWMVVTLEEDADFQIGDSVYVNKYIYRSRGY